MVGIMKLPSIQRCYLIGFLLVVAALATAGYLQYAKGLQPCPLCQLQRLCLGLIGLLFLFAVLHRPKNKGIKRYGWLILFFSGIGTYLAGKQVIMQLTNSESKTACGVSLEYIMQALPFQDAVKLILQGVGDCSRVEWRFLAMSLAQWTLIMFIILGVLAWAQNWRLKKSI